MTDLTHSTGQSDELVFVIVERHVNGKSVRVTHCYTPLQLEMMRDAKGALGTLVLEQYELVKQMPPKL
jgi:hypothetical protein